MIDARSLLHNRVRFNIKFPIFSICLDKSDLMFKFRYYCVYSNGIYVRPLTIWLTLAIFQLLNLPILRVFVNTTITKSNLYAIH